MSEDKFVVINESTGQRVSADTDKSDAAALADKMKKKAEESKNKDNFAVKQVILD